MTILIAAARAFAHAAHAAHAAVGQLRKYSGQPYVVHPLAVASLVGGTGARDEVIAAALCHDVVEDTAVTLAVIRAELGDDVARLVGEVTDVSRPEHGNRAARKAMDRRHIARASPEGKTIKLADLIDNAVGIAAHDPDFARTFMREKAALLEVLTEGDAGLLARAREIVRGYEQAQLDAALSRSVPTPA